MAYLGTYKISPNTNTIKVECYGFVDPAQRETLEQDGLSEHATIEQVMHNGLEITDYLSDAIIDELNDKVNEQK